MKRSLSMAILGLLFSSFLWAAAENPKPVILKNKKETTGILFNPVNIEPTHDAFLTGSGDNLTNGNKIRLDAGYRTGYMKFDLSGISGTITQVQLQFTVFHLSGSGRVDVSLGDNTTWEETTLNTASKPSPGALLGFIDKTYTIGNTETVDLDESLITAGQISLVLEQVNGVEFGMASKDNSSVAHPVLIVTTSTGGGGGGGSNTWSSNGNDVYYDTGDVGIGSTPMHNAKLFVRSDSSTENGSALMAWGSTSHTSGQITSLKGGWFLSLNGDSGTLDESIGADISSGNESSSSGTVDKAYGAIINVQDGTGTINNGYGLYIKQVNGTNSYGVYQLESTVENYFAGDVGIGTTNINGWKLAVEGKIRAREIRVDNDAWPDYVFEENYALPTLAEVEKHIREKGHLINIPSADEVEANGVHLGEMNKLLLEKIEELTLYILQQEKEQKKLKMEMEILKASVAKKHQCN